jgi:glycosyltransferase involved in cell wall biosynthesis
MSKKKMYPRQIVVASGIYEPDIGGPARFTKSFQEWCQAQNYGCEVLSLTDKVHDQAPKSDIFLISRSSFLRRVTMSVFHLWMALRKDKVILANGLFIEVLLASFLSSKKRNYACKVPGDIVWERARNRGVTSLSIDDFQSEIPLRMLFFRFMYSLSLKRARIVIVPSDHLRSLCLNWGVQEDRIKLIYNSVSTDLAIPKKTNKRYDVITVSRLVQWKGLAAVIQACAKLKLSLCIVGDGPEKLSLMDISNSLSANVDFRGSVRQDEIISVLCEGKYFVLNSSFEASSYALLEARALGLTCIARKSTGSEEVIHHQIDGFLCSTDEELIETLELLRNNPQIAQEFGEIARQDTLERFNRDHNFQKIFLALEM